MPSITGDVYDLDYLQNLNWCQVLVRDGFVGFVRDVKLQSVLEVALARFTAATLYYEEGEPNRIVRVSIRQDPPETPIPEGLNFVVEIDVNEIDGKCTMSLIGSEAEEAIYFTRDIRMQSLLLIAFQNELRVGELLVTTDAEISRAKLNIE